jgi:hypothetical protein
MASTHPERGARPELSEMPARIARLPLDARGYPVPWFVPWLANGQPEFRAMDVVKWARAVRERRCWVCGDTLGRHVSFVVGPMCTLSRTTAEPPSHLACATWSARNCPFLSRPHMRRREDDVIDEAALIRDAAGIAITRNPGVACVWTTAGFRIFTAHIGGQSANGGRLIEMQEPEHVEWYAEGRAATRAEVIASVEAGYPALDAICDHDPDPADSRRVLDGARRGVARWYPAS